MDTSWIIPTPTIGKILFRTVATFCEWFGRIYNNDEIPDADDEKSTPDVLDNKYLNMEVDLPGYDEGQEVARVVKQFWDKYGIPIGTAKDNPILDSWIYEVEYADGNQTPLAANAIAEIWFAQVDDEGHCSVLLQEIVNHHVNGREVTKEHSFIISPNGGRHREETT